MRIIHRSNLSRILLLLAGIVTTFLIVQATRANQTGLGTATYLPLVISSGASSVPTQPSPDPGTPNLPAPTPGETMTLTLPVPPDPPAGAAKPAKDQPCPAWVHDAYAAVGPDGKMYPTWHPVIDPKYGCTFDHEHGMDPRTWNHFKEVGFPPFGYVNAVEGKRKEDHVGNKVFVINDDLTGCSVMSKLHQGTHSPDAFVNNLHELHHHVRCADGRRIDARILASFGPSGEIKTGCVSGLTGLTTQEQTVKTGTPDNNFTSGNRLIANANCHALPDVVYEAWQSGVMLQRKDGWNLAYFDPIFAVFNPSRFFDPTKPNNLGRTIDSCRASGPALFQADCGFIRDNKSVTWDSPQSTFKGDNREWYTGQKAIFNGETGQNIWYCDPYGKNAQKEPFPGSVQVYVSDKPNIKIDGYNRLNTGFNNNGPGVKAPN